jgi:hypothetical protein
MSVENVLFLLADWGVMGLFIQIANSSVTPASDHANADEYEDVKFIPLSSLAQTLGSWVWIPLKAHVWSVYAFILFLCCPVFR